MGKEGRAGFIIGHVRGGFQNFSFEKSARDLGLFLFLIVALPAGLSARGKGEVLPEGGIKNAEWTLCVTSLDVSALPLSRQATGETVTGKLSAALKALEFRLRGDEESGYYRNYAWIKSRAEAAKALESKRAERDLLVYRGDPPWKYRKNLKVVDQAISKLEEDLAKIDALVPLVEAKPVFKFTEGNLKGSYPVPPVPGGEYRFCADQKADAVLSGSLSEYYGRIHLNLKMYTLYTRSYSYEDNILFSSEDLNGAVDELAARLAAAVSMTLPAGIAVHALPENAMILINGSYAGGGETGELLRSPGEVELRIYADRYVPVLAPVELNAGELAEISINLTPLGLSALDIDVPASPGSRVYVGGLFAGEAPLSLELPRTEFAYISVETPEGKTGSAVYRNNDQIKGSAQFVRKDEGGGSAAFAVKTPVSPEEKRVDKARRGFYGAYGVFWIALPVALLTAGISQNYINANNYVMSGGLYSNDYEKRNKIYNDAVMGRYITIGAYGVMGAALGVTFFQIFRYLYVSGGDAAPIVRTPPVPGTKP